MSTPTKEYEGDVYKNLNHNTIGPYLHGCTDGLFGFVSLLPNDLSGCGYVTRALSVGDRDWDLEEPEEYVMPKEFLM